MRKVIRCSVCTKPRWVETDPVVQPGHYSALKTKGSCKCKGD